VGKTMSRSDDGTAAAVGIDPGKNGAIAIVGRGGAITTVWVMPMIGAKGRKQVYDLVAISEICQGIKAMFKVFPIRVAIEKQQPLPPKMGGGIANFGRGYGLGIWEGALTAHGIPYNIVPPTRWQKQMLDGVQGETPKYRAEVQFSRMFNREWAYPGKRRKAHDGIVDAALIAEYARRTM